MDQFASLSSLVLTAFGLILIVLVSDPMKITWKDGGTNALSSFTPDPRSSSTPFARSQDHYWHVSQLSGSHINADSFAVQKP